MSARGVTIVGGGIASLLLAVELRTSAPHVPVELLAAEDEAGLGGHLHACERDGYPIEHGFHALFDFYASAKRLLGAHGLLERFVPAPDHVWVHDGARLRKAKNGLRTLIPPLPKRVWLSSLGGTGPMLRAIIDAARGDEEAMTRLDAIEFRDALRAFGLGDALPRSTAVQMFYDFGFVGDGPLSAGVALSVMSQLYLGGRMLHFPGPSKEVLIDPLVAKARALGVTLSHETRLTTIVLDDHDRVTHIDVLARGLPERRAVSELVIGVDVESFKALRWSHLEPKERDATPRFARDARALEGLVSVSAQAFFAEDPVPAELDQVVGGLPEPFSTLCPATRVRGRGPGPCGYELIACGPESGFESASDETLRERFLDTLALLNIGTDETRRRAHIVVRRNTRPSERYLATRPGELALRPEPCTSIANLSLVGAWTRVPFAMPSVEAASQSVELVRNALLARLPQPRRAPLRDARVSVSAPPYPPPPYRHEGVSRIVRLAVDPDALAARLPAGLTLAPSWAAHVLLFDSRYEAFALHDPTGARFLSQEVMLAAVVREPDRSSSVGLFPLTLFLDDDVATLVGRELYGFPKRLARIERSERGVRVVRNGLAPSTEGQVHPITLLDLSLRSGRLLTREELAVGDWVGRGLSRALAAAGGIALYNAGRTHPGGLMTPGLTRARAHDVTLGTPRLLEDLELLVGDSRLDPLTDLLSSQRVRHGVALPMGFTVPVPEHLGAPRTVPAVHEVRAPTN